MVTNDEIRSVAANARLDLDEDEVAALAGDLDDILDSFASLDDIDTDGVEPSFHPVESGTGPRADNREDCLSQDEALSNTENKEDGYFQGPRAV